MNLYPDHHELRALFAFVSKDQGRPYLCSPWQYVSAFVSDTTAVVGVTCVATDGQGIAVRRSGTHRTMSPTQIATLPVHTCTPSGSIDASVVTYPPPWASLFINRPSGGKLAEHYGMDPALFARVGTIERAAGLRHAADALREPTETAAAFRRRVQQRKRHACAVWTIPPYALDGWHWQIDGESALWQGVIMPRRV